MFIISLHNLTYFPLFLPINKYYCIKRQTTLESAQTYFLLILLLKKTIQNKNYFDIQSIKNQQTLNSKREYPILQTPN